MADKFSVGTRVRIDDEHQICGGAKGSIISSGLVDAVPIKRWVVKTDSGKEVVVMERYLELAVVKEA
jgi:hypothetical protein